MLLAQTDYNGLLLGYSECKKPHEFASVAIDVDLSYSEIRAINCPVKKCDLVADTIDYLSDNCCRSEYWSVCSPHGIISVQDSMLRLAETECGDHVQLSVDTPSSPIALTPSDCDCENPILVRYANVVDGRIGRLSPVSNIGSGTSLTFSQPVALYVNMEGGWHLQGIDTDFDLTHIDMGEPPLSEGWFNCPTDVRFLFRHSSGVMVTTSDNIIHISHPFYPHLWDKYKLYHCKEIISMKEVKGQIYLFDGSDCWLFVQQRLGYLLEKYADDVFIENDKQVCVYKGDIFIVNDQGVSSILGDQRGLNLGSITEEFINPEYLRHMSGDWAIGVYRDKIHFGNGEVSYIFNMQGDKIRALVQTSLMATDYITTSKGIFYLFENEVFEWNPVDGDLCPYTYCTSFLRLDGCKNIGAYKVIGHTVGTGTTSRVSKVSDCGETSLMCSSKCMCKPIQTTGCENIKGLQICFEGFSTICSHTYATNRRELDG